MLLTARIFVWLGPNRGERNNFFFWCHSFWGFWLWKGRIGAMVIDQFFFLKFLGLLWPNGFME
jgi:hypothetical protein